MSYESPGGDVPLANHVLSCPQLLERALTCFSHRGGCCQRHFAGLDADGSLEYRQVQPSTIFVFTLSLREAVVGFRCASLCQLYPAA